MANERTFKAKLRSKIKNQCFIQALGSASTAGLPDLFLSGHTGYYFIEVKYDDKTKGAITPKLSALQSQWLNNRYAEGRKVMVICGTSLKEGIIYEKGAWNEASNNRISFDEIVKIILEYVK